MSTLMLLSACAHPAPTPGPSLDGGWSNVEMEVFIGVEGAESTPTVWVVTGDSEKIWTGEQAARQPDGTVSFHPPEGAGPRATFTLTLVESDSVTFGLVYDSGREESHTLTRTAPRSRVELEQLIEAAAQAELEQRTAEYLSGIRTAEMAYSAAFDAYYPAAVWPRPVEALTPDSVPWPSGSDFDSLGWSPDGAVRGTFQVEVSQDGSDFTAHGWQDLDGDGVPAHWTATRQTAVTLVSAPGTR
ncbi:MAG: hypothetical protein ACI8RZ_001102 [Myxococcota bacterium]|jgi:hypothetical protein